ncbi:MAG: hypothetical protein HZC40_06970 [Chloroflexi bacterium]|nr:hypothetical protein [Chloroflexota bacterium]
MTGRERILAAYRGDKTDCVPFAPNVYLWFYYHHYKGTLPPALAHAQHPLDVLRALDADMLVRWDTQWATHEIYTAGEYVEEYVGENWDRETTTAFNHYPPRTNQRRRKFITPHGTLTQSWTFTPETATDFEDEYWWKDWDEYPAVRFMVEATDFVFERAMFDKWNRTVGDDGVMMVHLTQSPLKTLHWLAGPANASLFIMEHPDEMRALAKIHEEKIIALLEKIVDTPGAEIFVTLDNLDSAFHPPKFYAQFCDSFYSRAAEIIHTRGKFLMAHACGRNRALLSQVGASKLDALEGITPRPMGDVDLGAVRALVPYDRFTVNGGMDVAHLEIEEDAEARLHAYVRELFNSMGDKSHFVFASSCTTSPLTPWENLVYLRDAAREYGQM